MGDAGGVIADRLHGLGIALPRPPGVRARYEHGVVVGELLFLTGAIGTVPDGDGDVLPVAGKVGATVTVDDGARSARVAALNQLAMAAAVLGDLERVVRVVRLTGYVHAAPGFQEAPRVLDGASALYHQVFGPDRGAHARTSLYQHEMTLDAPIEIETILQVRP